MPNQHIVSGYDKDLKRLNESLINMANLDMEMTADALKALKNADVALAQDVIDRDEQVNKIEEQVNEEAERIMALRQPMASDLRVVISSIRMAADLERIGDLADGIGKRVIEIQATKYKKLSKGVLRMGKEIKVLLARSIELIKDPDDSLAVDLWLADDEIDDSYDTVFRELLTYMLEDSRNIAACTGLLFIAKNLERIGDHISNICEAVYYTVKGDPLIKDDRISIHYKDES